MLKILDKLLAEFRCFFSYEEFFNWSVIVILRFVIRFDHSYVKSFIRWLFLSPTHYDALLLKTAVTDDAQQLVHVITRAKKNYVRFLDREFSTKKVIYSGFLLVQ